MSHEDPQGRGDALVTLAAASRYLDEAVRDLRQEELERRTPCADWRLGELLSHVNKSLDELRITFVPGRQSESRGGPTARSLELEINTRIQRTLRAAFTTRAGTAVAIGDRHLDERRLQLVAALEIAVHGWDINASRGRDTLLADSLAVPLMDAARDVVPPYDRERQFAPPVPTSHSASPTDRLVSWLGRVTDGSWRSSQVDRDEKGGA